MDKSPILSLRRNFKIFLLTVGFLINLNSSALARGKSSKHRAYSYFDDGKSTQANCDPERKVPRKLRHETEFKKTVNYLGSEQVESELQAKNEGKMWKHFFSTQSACEKFLALQQKSYELKNGKLPAEKPAAAEDRDAEDTENEDNSETSE